VLAARQIRGGGRRGGMETQAGGGKITVNRVGGGGGRGYREKGLSILGEKRVQGHGKPKNGNRTKKK